MMHGISFPAWRDSHYLGLTELLAALGRAVADVLWELQFDEIAPGPQHAALVELSMKSEVSTGQLMMAAFPDGQIIDGELRGFVAGKTEPFITIRAIDSTEWDVFWDDDHSSSVVRAAFPNAVDIRS